MALDRTTLYNAASAPSGNNFLDQYKSFLDALIDTSVQRLTSVAGTNTITASAEPFTLPAAGLAAGMKFTFVPAANNTGAATLNIDSSGAQSIVNADGSALGADDLDDSTRYIVEYDGTNFVILSSVSASSGGGSIKTTYDSTDVWDNTFSATALVFVEIWGGGQGGTYGGTSAGNGGNGGACVSARFVAGDLPSSVTITIGGGGSAGTSGSAVGEVGGTTSFGSLLYAGGGGEVGAASIASAASYASPSASGNGGQGGAATGGDGGSAIFGGGGGGSYTGTSGGISVFGGNGGDDNQPGVLPGGGGGGGFSPGAGGGGRCIITVIGG